MDTAAPSLKTCLPTAITSQEGRLQITPSQIRQFARQFGPQGQVITTYLHQGWLEAKLRWRGNGYFRSSQNQRAVAGYAKLKPEEFKVINAVQSWANWRIIPKNLSGRLPAVPLRVLDLCCGTGDSTQVLACYVAPGSRIIGIEIDDRFVTMARNKTYISHDGQTQQVEFAVQDVLEPFHDAYGRRIEPHSVDLINVSGAVAVHFNEQSTAVLAEQCAGVIRPGGLALVDAGFEGASPRVVRRCFETHGFTQIHDARSCLLDLSRQLCLRRDE